MIEAGREVCDTAGSAARAELDPDDTTTMFPAEVLAPEGDVEVAAPEGDPVGRRVGFEISGRRRDTSACAHESAQAVARPATRPAVVRTSLHSHDRLGRLAGSELVLAVDRRIEPT